MPTVQPKIVFEQKGIASLLAHNRLAVPLNQREYSWEDEHVRALLEDFNTAIAAGTYFLGTVVLTAGQVPEVADGQQRLATTTIILAAIRDYFFKNGHLARATSITADYLATTDLETEQTVPKLTLNVDDRDFFTKFVVSPPDSEDRNIEPTKDSHKNIKKAAEITAAYIAELLSPVKESARPQTLINWVNFMKDDAQVIALFVPDHLNAFVMFETLNDRGLRASQADLLKNYLLSHAGELRINEAQQRWAEMLGALESLDIADLVVTYLRHFVICEHGPTKERELFQKVKNTVTSQQKSLAFLNELAQGSTPYSALFNPEHIVWNKYGKNTRGHIKAMIELGVEQIRPLMFAVLTTFEVEEAKKAFRLFVNWSVRFLIVGGRGGLLDRSYALRAQEVTSGKIKNTKALIKAMDDIVPNDATFEAVFAEARVSQTHLARYYLRSLERQEKGQEQPELIPNDDDSITTEHVLPTNPGPGWAGIDPDIAAASYKRLGNMALLPAKINVELGNKSFSEKKDAFKKSGFLLTTTIAEEPKWGAEEIAKRQKYLAGLAVKTWPLKV
jgi:hypothetical protein